MIVFHVVKPSYEKNSVVVFHR